MGLVTSATKAGKGSPNRAEFTSLEGAAAFWELWLRSLPLIMGAIARYRVPGGTDKADFRQAVLERVERKCRKAFAAFEGRSSLAWYLRRVVRSAAIEELRARKRISAQRSPLPGHCLVSHDAVFEAVEIESGTAGPACQLELSDRSEVLLQALQALASESDLSLRIARAVVSRCIDQRPRDEVSAELGVSVRQVNRYVVIGLNRLRSILSDKYEVLNEQHL
jgi:RNA polymerase sigma factor (sigma-70 family)